MCWHGACQSSAWMQACGRQGFVEEGVGEMVLQTITMYNEVKWFDNRRVTLLRPYTAIEVISNVKRFERNANLHVQIDCLSTVTTYNQFMGGVNPLD